MIICKICNPSLEGNGYCAEHSTGGTSYLEKPMTNLQTLLKNQRDDLSQVYNNPWTFDSKGKLGDLESFLKTSQLQILSAVEEMCEKQKKKVMDCMDFHNEIGNEWTPCGNCGLRRDEIPKIDKRNEFYNQAIADLKQKLNEARGV